MRTGLLRILSACLLLAPAVARAENATIVLPLTGPHTMAELAGIINNAFLAAETCNSGSSVPTNGPGGATFHYQCWIDTSVTPNLYKIRDNASTWITLGSIDSSVHTFTLFGPTAAVDTNTTQLATTAFVLGQAASATPLIDGSAAVGTATRYARADHVHPTDSTRAPLASPGLTGTPTAPTAAVDTNTTQLATTAFVLGQAAAATPLIDGSAAAGTATRYARADHVHPTDTTRAPLASPGLTGTPTAPTAAVDTNTTQLATTAFVLGQAASATPLIDGSAAVGTATRFARADHIHPTDTTRAPTASPAFTGVADVQNALKLSSENAPAQITVDQNDYNPSAVVCLSTSTLLINSSAARNVTGIAGGSQGCELYLINNGSFAITLKDSSVSSSAANRFGFGADYILASKGAIHLKYDGTDSLWRNMSGTGGAGGGGTMTGVTAGGGCVSGSSGQAAITTSGTVACAPGQANKLRNAGLTSWFSGTGLTITTSGGWCAEGMYVVPTGASITCFRTANPLANPLSFYAMQIIGLTSVTDVVVRWPISSIDAAPLAGQQVTCQWPIINNTGGSITPTLTVRRANTQDATYTNTDVSASLQTITNGSTGTLAYSWLANANSFNGLSIDISFGNNFSTNAKAIQIGGGFDCRVTPGVSTGTVSAPPQPEIPTAAYEAAWNMVFFEATYDNGTAPGSTTAVGEQDRRNGATNSDLWNILYKVPKRADATVTLYSPNSGTAAKCYNNTGAADIGAGVFNASNGMNGASITQTSGTAAVGDAIRCHWTADARLTGG